MHQVLRAAFLTFAGVTAVAAVVVISRSRGRPAPRHLTAGPEEANMTVLHGRVGQPACLVHLTLPRLRLHFRRAADS